MIEESLEQMYLKFCLRLLSDSSSILSEKTRLRNSVFAAALERTGIYHESLESAVESSLEKIVAQVKKHNEAIASLRQNVDSQVGGIVKAHEEKIQKNLQDGEVIKKNLESYNSPVEAYAFLHPVQLPDACPYREAFRLILPVKPEELRAYGTVSEQLFRALFVGLVNDSKLGKGGPQYVKQVGISFGDSQVYAGIDIVFQLDPKKMQRIVDYIATQVATIGQRSISDLVCNVCIIQSPTHYHHFIQSYQSLLEKYIRESDRPLEEAAEKFMSAASVQGGDAKHKIKQILLEMGVVPPTVLPDPSIDLENDFYSHLNKLAGFQLYSPRVVTVKSSSFIPGATVEAPISEKYISLEQAALLTHIPVRVLERGFGIAYHRVAQDGTDFIATDELTSAFHVKDGFSNIVRGHSEVAFFSEPVMRIGEFCDRFGLDRLRIKQLAEGKKIPGEVMQIPSKEGELRNRGYVFYKKDLQSILSIYNSTQGSRK